MELSSDFTVYAVIWVIGCVVIAAGIVALLVGLVIDGVKRRRNDDVCHSEERILLHDGYVRSNW